MQELRLVAVSEDGSYLVLATAGRGTRFTLPVDDRLRAAVRGHFSRLGQFEIEVESPLRPKEIQARIRAGETAEEIAESAGIPVERVRWFEGPVLQEREYMAQQAQRVIARRQGDASPGPPLGEMVEERLGRRGVDLEEVEWDSWKCEDSTWRVRLSFFDDGRPHAAEWVFDPRRRQVSALDEEAARLSSLVLEEPAAPSVTPLVSRRPAMKIVSDSRSDVAAEQRREYGAERGRIAEPRRQSLAPHRREYVAPAENDIVAAPRARYVPEPPTPEPVPAEQQDVDTVAQAGVQATGVHTGEAEAPDQVDRVAQASPAAESEPQAPPAEVMVPPRPVAAEAVTQVATEPETVAGPDTVAETENAAGPETPDEGKTADGRETAAAAEAAHQAAEAVSEASEQPRAEPRERPAAATAGKPAAEPAAEVAEQAAPEPAAQRDPKPTARKAAPAREPEPAPAEPVAAEEEEEQEQAEKVPAAAKRKVAMPAPTSPAPAEPPARPGRRKNSARGKRASVPSWDEIMFGARRPD